MPLVNKSFSEIITFTRSTGGGRFNASGQYEWLPADQPRIDYDPVTGECRGLLIEESRTNLLTHSRDFANAAWAKSAGVSVAAAAGTAPDGTVTATKLTPTTGGQFVEVYQNTSATIDNAYTGTYHLKYAGLRYIQIIAPASVFGTFYVNFDLQSGVVSASDAGTSSGLSFGITAAGNGYWRIRVTATALAESTAGRFAVNFIKTATTLRGVNEGDFDGTSGIYIWGAQLELGAFPTSYIPTTSAQVTRAADIASVNELSPWFNPEQGTLIARASQPVIFASSRSVASLAVSATSRTTLYRQAGGSVNGYFQPGAYASVVGVAASAGIVWSHAITYRGTSTGYAVDGLTANPFSNSTSPANYVSLFIGNAYSGAPEYLNGHIESIRFIPRFIDRQEQSTITMPPSTLRNIAHRGDSANAPENTIAAYSTESAMRDFDWWECDVGLTADGHFVLMHDATVDRTTDGTGSLSSLTLAQVKALDAGSWKGPQFAGEQVPTLAEFLAHCAANGKGCYPELKSGVDAAKAAEFIAIVDANIPRSRVVVQSFSITTLQNVRAAAGDIELGYLFGAATPAIADSIQALGQPYCALMNISGLNVEGKMVLDSRRIPYDLWTLTTSVQKSKCSAFGARGVMSDFYIEVK